MRDAIAGALSPTKGAFAESAPRERLNFIHSEGARMKIAIIANCQGESIQKCLMALNPSIEAVFFMVHNVVNDNGWIERLLQENDFILAHRQLKNASFPLPDDKVLFVPNVAFNGFHPDLTFVRGTTKQGEVESVVNILSGYVSGIALYAYQQGMSVEQAELLFRPEIYARLGYFDVYSRAYEELIDEGRLCKLPLDGMLARWSRMPPFMYSSNHPKMFVVEDIVRSLMQKMI